MTASHGRVGRRGCTWLTTALAASGLFLAVSTTRPARADQIHPVAPPADAVADSITPGSPSQGSQQALPPYLEEWQCDKSMAQPQSITLRRR